MNLMALIATLVESLLLLRGRGAGCWLRLARHGHGAQRRPRDSYGRALVAAGPLFKVIIAYN